MRCHHRRTGYVFNEAVPSDPFDAVHALLEENSAAALEQLLDRATGSIREPYAADPNHAWYVAGDIYVRQGAFALAQDCFLNSLDTRLDDVDSLVALANCASALGDTAVSEKYLRAALKQSESAAVLYSLGNALLDQGKFGEALCYFKRVAVSDSEIYAMAQRNLERCHAMRRDR